MLGAPNARHQQVAYVTSDLDRAMQVFKDVYGAAGFFTIDSRANNTTLSGGIQIKIALTRIGGVEYELIEPIGDTAPLYKDFLPADGAFAIRFHHVCVRITGDIEDWNRHRATVEQSGHDIVFQGEMGQDMRFCYTDERPFVGHYLEHVWMSQAMLDQLKGIIPAVNE